MTEKQRVDAAKNALIEAFGPVPEVGIVFGTGLSFPPERFRVRRSLPFTHIPHLIDVKAPSHQGAIALGDLGSTPVLCLKGRVHLYDGAAPAEVCRSVRVLLAAGVKTLVLTNASGGLHPGVQAGQVGVLVDHVNLTGHNPLIGQDGTDFGERFPDCSHVYDKPLAHKALDKALALGVDAKAVVYAGVTGPNLETPAEVRALRTLGADVVGMSTVLEALAAHHMGGRLLALTAVCNVHTPDAPVPTSLDDVLSAANAAALAIARIIHAVLEG